MYSVYSLGLVTLLYLFKLKENSGFWEISEIRSLSSKKRMKPKPLFRNMTKPWSQVINYKSVTFFVTVWEKWKRQETPKGKKQSLAKFYPSYLDKHTEKARQSMHISKSHCETSNWGTSSIFIIRVLARVISEIL